MNILVVEDELFVAEYLQRALTELGISSFIAPTADQADEILGRHDIDAVTLDLAMPGRSGMEWLESVARERPELARKTLVITGTLLEPEGIARLARCGAGILCKPFNLEDLREAVRTQLSRPHSRRARPD